MKNMWCIRAVAAVCGLWATFSAFAGTTAPVPSDGVYKFTFGVTETHDGSIPVPADAVCDVNGTMAEGQFSYGFLGTTDDSYRTDVPANLPTVPHAIDGFSVVKGQKIVLHDTTDANGVPCVTGPDASEYLPRGASSFEGRYPVRFSMRAEERAYYAVTCTVANASTTANADVTLFSERCHTHAQHLTLAPGETKTFAWSVELAPNFFKTPAKFYNDNAINVVVVGENAALASLTVVKQPQTAGTVRGGAVENMNVGKTMWLCDDSTGTDQRCDTPYFTLQNYSGVGSGLSRWAPANLSIRNQGEGGLATNAGTHRKSCLLKPGDYLYVEYGHNEASTESYKTNFETYLADANEAGANLVIVSPLERHYSWTNFEDGVECDWHWGRSLQGYAEAGEAWVEAKIAAGAKNVAFIDLNKPFADWMNVELVRINSVNPSVSLKNAIDYYFCAKGGKVDATHPNNAGADWGAYLVWSNALERVAAGEAEGATESQRIQAAVLKGITEGVQLKVGLNGTADNTPWLVSDEIINAGRASNSYWDTAVRAGYDYVNDAAVAAVDATCENGVVTLNGVTMRVMNHVNYAKAVIDIVSADGATTTRWYSFYNYDASGNISGELVVPEQPGFINEDLDKDTAPGEHFSETLTIPAGAKAYIWFAEADGNTWQVGENAPFSAIYPLEAWTSILVDDDCSDVSTWEKTSQSATFETVDGESGISFVGNGAAFTRELASTVESGRIRVSFKARYDEGELVFVLSDANGGDQILKLNGSSSVFGTLGPLVTVSVDETPVPQTAINLNEWMDVDMTIDLDARKVYASVGGSDYKTFNIETTSHMPYRSFGITLASGSHSGAIDDVQVVTLPPTPQLNVSAAVNNAAYGAVAINGVVASEAIVFAGSDVAFTAVSADLDAYAFDHWEDANGNSVSTAKTLVVENIAEGCSYTAVFREYGEAENRVITWDFSNYRGDFAVVPTAATTVAENGMSFVLQSGDAMTGNGLKWKNPATGAVIKNPDALSEGGDHYIVFTPAVSGTLTIKFSVDGYESGRKPTMCIKAANSAAECVDSKADNALVVTAANQEYTFTANLTAGTKYYIWAYSYNWSAGGFPHNYSIPSITYSYALVRDVAFDIAEGETTIQAGTIAKANNVEKTGAGTLVLVGNNDFLGTLLIGAGTVRLGGAADIPGALYDFDASAEDGVVVSDGSVVGVKDRLGFCENLYPNGTAGEPTTINGRGAVKITERYRTVESMAAGATFFVGQYLEGGKSWNALIKQVVDSEVNANNYSITEFNDGVLQRRWSNLSTDTGTSGRKGTANLYKNGGASTAIDTNPMVFTVNMVWQDGSSAVWYGPNKSFAIGEILAYANSLSDAEREAAEAFLMAKWGIGEAAYTPLPTDSRIEIASGATLDLGGLTQHVASLSVRANGVVTNGTLVVASEPSIAVGASAAATDNGDGTWTVVWVSPVVVDTHSFTWNWDVAEGSWNDPANWLYEGGVPANDYPKNAAEDYATFNTAAKVNLTAAAYVKEVWANADVELAGAQTMTLSMSTGDGTITLNGVGLSNVSGKSMVVSNDLVIAGAEASWFNALSSTVELRGDISGSAPMNFWLADDSSSRVSLYGNNNEYTGNATVSGGYQFARRSVFSWQNENAAGTNAYWTVEYNAAEYNKDEYRMVRGTTRFGGYWGEISDTARGTRLVIGYLNRNSYIYPINKNGPGDDRRFDVEKVGTADLRIARNYIRNLILKSGSVSLDIQGMDFKTLTIAADTTIYVAGDAAWAAGTVTNLFSYTTLAGTGTLAEQVEVTGLAEGLVAKITVANNTVTATIEAAEVAPTVDDENATITKNGDGTYTVEVEAEEVAITVPDGVMVSEVVVSPDTTKVTGVPTGAAVKVAVSWTDAQETQHSAAYAIVKIDADTGAVTLDEDAVVTVGEEEISLKPALSDEGDADEPLVVGDDVSVGVKSIPGLTYRLVRGSAPDEIATSDDSAVATEQAKGARVGLKDENPPEGSAFYRITVGVK